MKKSYIYLVSIVSIILASSILYFIFLRENMYPVNISGIDVNKKPNNIVSLSSSITNFARDNGYKEIISGISDFYDDTNEDFKDIKRLGTSQDPNISEIISLKPDYVLTSTPLNNVLKNEIEKNKITVLEIFTSVNYDGMKDFYKNLFLLFEGKSNGIKKYNQYVKENEQKINSLIYNLSIPQDQTFAIISEKSIISTNDTVENYFISKVMGQSILKDTSSFNYDINKLKEDNPTYIIVKEGINISDIEEMNAYKEGRVIYINFLGFEQNNYLLIYQDLEKICNTVYNTQG